ncbi:MAG: site-specific integrase [Bacteroidetes bacterium]|nr:site-specific integrase [Bacteroidota bacterium]
MFKFKKEVGYEVGLTMNFINNNIGSINKFIAYKEISGVRIADLTKDWHVYYKFRSPHTKKLVKFTIKKGINRHKNIPDRMFAIKAMLIAVETNLRNGFNPFEAPVEELSEALTVENALKQALDQKIKHWSESTIYASASMYTVFERWLTISSLHKIDISELTKRHIAIFLNQLKNKDGSDVSGTTRNNYRTFVSGLVKQLVDDDILPVNFVTTIPKVNSKPKKNRPFTKDQLVEIKKYLLENDPYLYTYIQFVMYAFLRPIEVSRIQLKNINLKVGIIQSATKTDLNSTVLIIDSLRSVIEKMDLNFKNKNHYLFTPSFKPDNYETVREKSKADFFIARFKRLKTKLDLGSEYGLYSFRHTFALDLYNNFVSQGLTQLEAKHKLMSITRHKSLAGLDNYLRDIGAVLPKDYSSDFTVNF